METFSSLYHVNKFEGDGAIALQYWSQESECLKIGVTKAVGSVGMSVRWYI